MLCVGSGLTLPTPARAKQATCGLQSLRPMIQAARDATPSRWTQLLRHAMADEALEPVGGRGKAGECSSPAREHAAVALAGKHRNDLIATSECSVRA